MNVAIIGCGKMGQRRAAALSKCGCKLVACDDINPDAARALANQHEAEYVSFADIFTRPDIDMVIISTPHNSLKNLVCSAIGRRKNVLVEKPAGRNVKELDECILADEDSYSCTRVGFNHRYHRAIRRAYEMVDAGEIGPLMYIRGHYGHGGRLGYEKEWRADKLISGGGELIDQGVHLIDLARWFLGDLKAVCGLARNYFWPMSVEDNGFMLLQNADNKVAFMHASCTEWKNSFSFEIFGETGKLEIDGLGGSYGVEKLTLYKMRPEMGPPDTTTWEYPTEDDSLEVEFNEFMEDIRLNRTPEPGLADARSALSIVEEIYQS